MTDFRSILQKINPYLNEDVLGGLLFFLCLKFFSNYFQQESLYICQLTLTILAIVSGIYVIKQKKKRRQIETQLRRIQASINILLDIRNQSIRAQIGSTHWLSRQAIQALPIRQSSGVTCAVCQSEIRQNSTIRSLGCSHEFHLKCLDEWISIKAECPLCKVQIN